MAYIRNLRSAPVLQSNPELEAVLQDRWEPLPLPISVTVTQDPTPPTTFADRLADHDQTPSGLVRLQTYQRIKSKLQEGRQTQLSKDPGHPLSVRIKSALRSVQSVRPFSLKPEPLFVLEKEKQELLREFALQTNGRKLVHKATFKEILKVRGESFAEQLFRTLDSTSVGYVTDEQLVSTLLTLQRGSMEEKIAFIWSIIAADKDEITRVQLSELFQASCAEGHLSLDTTAIETLTNAFFARAARAEHDTLSLADFSYVLSTRPEVMQSLTFGGLDLSCSQTREKAELTSAVEPLPLYERCLARLLQKLQVDSLVYSFWVCLLVLAQLAGFVVGFMQNCNVANTPDFAVMGWTLPIAKGAARAIQVIVVLLPFTVARSLLTMLRATPLAAVLPLDQHLDMHRLLAYQFFVWGCLHSICHFVNADRKTDPSRYHTTPINPIPTEPEYYAQETQVTGLMLIGILCLGYLFAAPWPRKTALVRWLRLSACLNHFEAFYVSHLLMAASVVILLIIHPRPGPVVNPVPHKSTTWVYLVGGVVVYTLERVSRLMKRVLWSTGVIAIYLHPGNVTELRLEKPSWTKNGFRSFKGKPGQYCFLNVPALSRYEWHPFSLTSAPADDFISFHIRAAGDWTKSFHSLCEKTTAQMLLEDPLDDSSRFIEEKKRKTLLKIHVDGPFGAPAQDHSAFNVLLLVGAGIGVTPFAAVLRQLMDEYNKSLCKCCNTANERLFKPRKVYFFWMTHEQHAPKYFQQTLEAIKELDCSGFLEINIYSTAALPANDLRVTFARVAQVVKHEEDGFDACSNTYQPAPCYFGRPNWPAVFAKVSAAHPESKVGVFVCGPAVLSSQLNGICVKSNRQTAASDSPLLGTRFVFHKENF